ncbi:MAG: hypothetical protein H6742_11460 [Alphaproteobacteria bacterium]|nr:hypothetical protein [Alphaproteobacteria bacterium]
MEQLVDFLLRSVATQPDDVRVNMVDGRASILFEVDVADADRERFLADDRALLQAMQAVLGASAGRKKAVLDLLEPGASFSEE